MATKTRSANPLIITGKAPDAPLNVQLHPLVLLGVSDYYTRHTIRKQPGPIVGAIIGQQNGRNFTLEHTFHCLVAGDTDEIQLDAEWFVQRLEMYKEVHKEPALDMIGLFAIGPVDGPQPKHLPLLKQVQELTSSDSIMLLLFHPEQVDNLEGSKLPISLYEKVEETEGEQTHTRFRELNFEVETGDAERIAVDFVAKGGGSAAAVSKSDNVASASKEKKSKGKGKAKDDEGDAAGAGQPSTLSAEDDELISSLTAKVNAIKMLSERIDSIRNYLQEQPESYLTDASSTNLPPESTNFSHLRSIQAVVSRIPLLAPPSPSTQHSSTGVPNPASNLVLAGEKERQDVHLTSLLASLTRSLAEAQSMGAKFNIVQREKTNRERAPLGRAGAGIGRMGGDEGILADAGGS